MTLAGSADAGLSEMQRSALQELANIGAGHAASALAQMIGQTVSIDVPKVMAVRLEDAPQQIGDPESVVVAVFFRVIGEAPCRMLLLFSPENARMLVDMVSGKPARTTQTLDEEGASAVKEVGNILSGSYLNALSKLVGLNLVNSVPGYSEDMLEAVLQSALMDLGQEAEFAFLIATDLIVSGHRVNAHFLLVPHADSLQTLLRAMMRFSAPEESA